MRWKALYVSGVGACLPDRTSAEEAVRQGRYPAEDHADNEIAAVAVSESQAAPVMAADAARQALARCGHGPTDIAIVLHASAYYQGQDLWTPACYVQREALGGTAAAIAVDGASNGALAGLELAGAYLSTGPGRMAALISAADRYCAPGFDRWGSDSGVVFGDGASAVVLSRVDGFARVLASNITGGPELEEAARVTSYFAHAPLEHGAPLDLAGRKSEFIKRFGYEEFMYRLADGVADNVGRTMTDAGTAMDDVRWVILPNFGRTVLEWEFLDPLGVPIERTLWDWGRHVGHLGPADQFAGVEHLLRSGTVEAGDRVLLVGIGVGFTWGSALLEWKEKTDL